jgi:hypothetical protein
MKEIAASSMTIKLYGIPGKQYDMRAKAARMSYVKRIGLS